MPNILRAILGRASSARWDRVVGLECNLDDLVPEHFDHVMERLLAAGALDVSLSHVQTKKNRPGFLLRVLARPRRDVTLVRDSILIAVQADSAEQVLRVRHAIGIAVKERDTHVVQVCNPLTTEAFTVVEANSIPKIIAGVSRKAH